MKFAIIYATKHGCTNKCAHTLANNLDINTALFNIETDKNINISNYDSIILGGSIHAGAVNKKLSGFMEKNLNILLQKNLGLFICCMFEGDQALEQFRNAFPESIRNKAEAHGLFGGELTLEKMNLFEKAIIKKIANVEENVSKINYSNIKAFAEKMKSQ